jgi:hypothetical protein
MSENDGFRTSEEIVLAELRIRPWSLYTDPDPHLRNVLDLEPNLEVQMQHIPIYG